MRHKLESEKVFRVTRNDIIRVYSKWERDVRLNPTMFASKKEIRSWSLLDHATRSADVFIKYLGGKK
jgi:hypothetical protein